VSARHVVRGHQGGKTAAVVAQIARGCSMPLGAIEALLRDGWTYERHLNSPSVWRKSGVAWSEDFES